MTLMLGSLMLAGLAVTFANGANDNFKGVATLYGSGTTSYRRALAWATITTAAGSLAATMLAGPLVSRFSGKGLVPNALTADPTFLLAVGGGAAATVLLASLLGLPISTTHALTGALVGAGLLAADGHMRFAALGGGFIVPLFVSPFVAAATVWAAYPAATSLRRRWGIESDTCVCITPSHAAPVSEMLAGAQTARNYAASAAPAPGLPVVGSIAGCAVEGLVPVTTASRILDAAHYLSAGAVSFARGVNDAPKLLALLLPAQVLSPSAAVPLVALVMALGGLLGARGVAETMSHRVTAMNPGQGFAANFVTAGLVLVASRFGLPVSTTHVSNGALFGLGAVTGGARRQTIAQIVLAWVVTLPCAGAGAALLWRLAK